MTSGKYDYITTFITPQAPSPAEVLYAKGVEERMADDMLAIIPRLGKFARRYTQHVPDSESAVAAARLAASGNFAETVTEARRSATSRPLPLPPHLYAEFDLPPRLPDSEDRVLDSLHLRILKNTEKDKFFNELNHPFSVEKEQPTENSPFLLPREY